MSNNAQKASAMEATATFDGSPEYAPSHLCHAPEKQILASHSMFKTSGEASLWLSKRFCAKLPLQTIVPDPRSAMFRKDRSRHLLCVLSSLYVVLVCWGRWLKMGDAVESQVSACISTEPCLPCLVVLHLPQTFFQPFLAFLSITTPSRLCCSPFTVLPYLQQELVKAVP